MRSSGEGLARAISLTMAQTFCLAVSMTGPMEPEQSMQKTTSILGLSCSGLGGSAVRAEVVERRIERVVTTTARNGWFMKTSGRKRVVWWVGRRIGGKVSIA